MRIELLLFLSFVAIIIAIIACSVPRRPTPALPPTLFPAMTLTSYNPHLFTHVGGDAAISATILPPPVGISDIDISPPRCYQTGTPQLTCLGIVRNAAQNAISNITLRARFRGSGDEWQGQRTFSLEQHQIAPQGSAPYRFQVPDSREEAAVLEISALDARRAAASTVDLKLADMQGQYLAEPNEYRFSATLVNESGRAAAGIRLIVMLEDESGSIIGYRAADLPDQLASGADVRVDLTIRPLKPSDDLRHRVTVQAFQASETADTTP